MRVLATMCLTMMCLSTTCLASLSAQAAPRPAADSTIAIVGAADSTRAAPMRVEIHGTPYRSIGVAPGRTGSLSLTDAEATATGTIAAQLGADDGMISFTSAPGAGPLDLQIFRNAEQAPSLRARGHIVRVIRERGEVRIEAAGEPPR